MKNWKNNMGTILVVFVLFLSACLLGCTENERARNYGGEQTVKLPKGEKLIEATWKENNLWYLTEPMDSDYIPKTRIFQESSDFGVWNGKIIFIESK